MMALGAMDTVVDMYLERIRHIADYGGYAPLDRY